MFFFIFQSKDAIHDDISLRDLNFDCNSPENGRRNQGLGRGIGGLCSQQAGLRPACSYAVTVPQCQPPPPAGVTSAPNTFEASTFSTTSFAVSSLGSSVPSTAVASAGNVGLLQQQQQQQPAVGASQLERRLARTLNKLCQTIDRGDLRLADDDRRHANRIEWQQVSVVVDRLLLVVFTVGTVAITVGILLHAPHSRLFLFGESSDIVSPAAVVAAAAVVPPEAMTAPLPPVSNGEAASSAAAAAAIVAADGS